MATGDGWPYQDYYWPTTTTVTGHYGSPCNHGTPYGSTCYYCLHPAMGPASQTFQLGGWTCAGCGHGYAPSLTECPRCPQQKPAGDGAFGPFEPILPVPVDDPDGPRPESRRWEYPVCTPALSDLCVTQEPGTGGGLRHAPPGVTTACPCPTEGGLCGCEEGDGDGTCASFDCSC